MTDFDEYLLLEQKVEGIDVPTIYGVPIWKLVRTHFRWKYRGTRPFTIKPNIQIWEIVRNFCNSFGGLTKILTTRKKCENVFFPHPRLFYVNGQYMERFSDSLIESAGIQHNSIIFERHQNGIHRRPRVHSGMVVYLDFIDNMTIFLLPFVKLWVRKKYSKPVQELYNKLNDTFHLDNSYLTFFNNTITQFVISRWLLKPILKSLSPHRIFFAPRGTYNYAVSLCKEMGILSIEMEHGIVIGKTDLYTGNYDQRIDPDYMLVFGADNVGEQYGMPIKRIINVGYPYKDFINNVSGKKYGEKTILVVSEPEITDKIIDVLIKIVSQYPDYVFHIRCHPQEKITSEQQDKIKGVDNIKVVDNTMESFIALNQYQTVIGEKSSVLFEAMSLHKKVGRLNFGGLVAIETGKLHGGTIINTPEDFNAFMKTTYSDENDSKDLYSDFNPDALKILGL